MNFLALARLPIIYGYFCFLNLLLGSSGRKWINEVQSKIVESLGPIFADSKSVALMDLPNYWNLGDSFIWLGERLFFQNISLPIVASRYQTWSVPEINNLLRDNGIIAMQGGGNLGDLYLLHQDARLKAFANFRKKKIVVMPQSVYFANRANLLRFAQKLKQFSHVTIACRCKESLRQLGGVVGPNTKLVLAPDMAFMIGDVKPVGEPSYDVIFLSRQGEKRPEYNESNKLVRSLEAKNISILVVDWSAWSANLHPGEETPGPFDPKLPDFRLELATRILSKGRIVMSDRMHGVILGMLMGKPVVALDNIYDKFGRVYETFLSGYSKEELGLERVASYEQAEVAIEEYLKQM